MVEQGAVQLAPGVLRGLQEEAAVMARMRHPNLLNLLGLCALPPCLLTEYCERGSLFDVLRAAAASPQAAAQLTWRRRLSMVRVRGWRAVHAGFGCACGDAAGRRQHATCTRNRPPAMLLECRPPSRVLLAPVPRRRSTRPPGCCTCTTARRPSSTATVRRPGQQAGHLPAGCSGLVGLRLVLPLPRG